MRLLTGRGCYSDDFNLAGQVYAVVVRSPHAHARITAIETEHAAGDARRASRSDGRRLCRGRARSDDLFAGGSPPARHSSRKPRSRAGLSQPPIPSGGGTDAIRRRGSGLHRRRDARLGKGCGRDRTRRLYAARCGNEFRQRPPSRMPRALLDEGGPNLVLDAGVGDHEATERAFAAAAYIARLSTWVQRVTGVPMEPRAALAEFDPASGRITLYAGGGSIGRPRQDLSAMLGVPKDKVRVIARDVGGNFGTRNSSYPEFTLVAWAARRLGRPVKWTGERQETFLSDHQARDLRVEAELALDAEGNFLALRGDQSQQSRRLRRVLRAIDQGHRADVEPLSHPGGAGAGAGRAEQHAADQPLPQRRTARGHVRHRAADRSCGSREWLRPGRVAPQEPDPGRLAALCQPVRHDL